jgi:DNA adenine methylase
VKRALPNGCTPPASPLAWELKEEQVAPARESLRPPVKWAGGKTWQLPLLRQLWQPHADRRLVEPFCGALGVAFGLMPTRALLNDANVHIMNFYAQVRRGLRIDIELRNDKALFYDHRARLNALSAEGCNTAETAGLFYYLNRTGYNGLCRYNRRGEYNVPFGRYVTINYQREFPAHQLALADWTLIRGDFQTVPLRPADFVYADPPYHQGFVGYTSRGFGWPDHRRLAEWLAGHHGPVIATNAAAPSILDMYCRLGFDVRLLEAPRRIGRDGNRQTVCEMLATRNIAQVVTQSERPNMHLGEGDQHCRRVLPNSHEWPSRKVGAPNG